MKRVSLKPGCRQWGGWVWRWLTELFLPRNSRLGLKSGFGKLGENSENRIDKTSNW
jgi:hypothetical protein